ncbi:hypothetical protein [Agarivorans litoreus]|uniref:hypothetical protein n=1 Tax=Agarivorans litoreus TaxID=1510455 RepID=UPI001C7D2394|nr:hypothetical protein [Agarivorans litoreus]
MVTKTAKVAEKTWIKFEKAITNSEDLPNSSTQQLAGCKPSTLTSISVSTSLHTISKIAEGIGKEAAKQGFTSSISTINELNHNACNQVIDD